ncbi:MAG: large conductance mechanosensitive channel protein MscL [Ruminococcaceae bacterium]|nr:large conductance mechanosensitive channel protein MscL [Oscillospiraceae bacterium]
MEKKVKNAAKKLKKQNESFWADFKKFITKGNVLDMAVAVVVASAFNAIVNGLVKYIITPLITYATSGVSINEWEWVVREEVLDAAGAVVTSKISVQYGLWLQAIVDFLIIAFSVFVVVRVIRNTERALNAKELAKKAEEEAAKKAEEEKKAAEAAAAAKAAAEAQKAREDAFLADVKAQAELLREIRDSLKKN